MRATEIVGLEARSVFGTLTIVKVSTEARELTTSSAPKMHGACNSRSSEGACMSIQRRSIAEFLGTFWLVFGGCGSAVLAASFPNVGIGLLGVSLAFGLTVLTMAYAIGHISGCHLNPAVSVGLAVGRRFSWSEVLPYVVAQVVGATVAAFVLYS